jgi:hypothetical protein
MTTTNTSSHLASDKVNLLELKEWLRREFLSFFEDCNGKKVRYNKNAQIFSIIQAKIAKL